MQNGVPVRQHIHKIKNDQRSLVADTKLTGLQLAGHTACGSNARPYAQAHYLISIDGVSSKAHNGHPLCVHQHAAPMIAKNVT